MVNERLEKYVHEFIDHFAETVSLKTIIASLLARNMVSSQYMTSVKIVRAFTLRMLINVMCIFLCFKIKIVF